MSNQKNNVGLIGFILSIASIITCGFTSIFGLILSILGLVESSKKNNDKKGLSIAGIVISSMMLLFFFFLILFAFADTNYDSNNSKNNVVNSSLVSKEKIKVIDFNNMTQEQVNTWCNDNNINCKFSDDYSSDIEKGMVISQNVERDTVVDKGSTIKIVISKGRKKSSEEIKNDFINSCSEYNYNDVARNPDNYKGYNAKFFGQVSQVSEGLFNNVILRVGVSCTKYEYIDGYSCPDTIYVTYKYKDGEPRILEDDMLTIYGTLDGLESYTSVLGAKITLPKIKAKYITIN